MTSLNPKHHKKLIDETMLNAQEQEWVKAKAGEVAERFGLNSESPAEKIDEKRSIIREQILDALEEELESGQTFDADSLDENKINAVVAGVTNAAIEIKKLEDVNISYLIELDRAKARDVDKEQFAYSMRMGDNKSDEALLYSAEEAEERALRMQKTVLENDSKKRELGYLASSLVEKKRNIEETKGEVDALQSDIDQYSKDILLLKNRMTEVEAVINKIADLELIAQEDKKAQGGFFATLKKWFKGKKNTSSAEWSREKIEEFFDIQEELQIEILEAMQKLNEYMRDQGNVGDLINENVEILIGTFDEQVGYACLIDRQNVLRVLFSKLAQGAENAKRLKNAQRQMREKDLDTLKDTVLEKEAQKESIDSDLDIESQFPEERRKIFYSKFGQKIVYIRNMKKTLHKVAVYGESRRVARIETIAKLYFELRAEVMKFENITGLTGNNGFLTILDMELGSIKVNDALTNAKAKIAIDDLERVQRALATVSSARAKKSHNIEIARARIERVRLGTRQNNVDTDTDEPAAISAPEMVDTGTDVSPAISAPKMDDTGTDVSPAISAHMMEDTGTDVSSAISAPKMEEVKFIGLNYNERLAEVCPDFQAMRCVFIVGECATNTRDAHATQPLVTAEVGEKEDDPKPQKTAQSTDRKESKESREIQRESETLYIGDMNGSYTAFVKYMTALKAIRVETSATGEEKLIWTAGDRKIVLMGDDLNNETGNLKINLVITDLQDQARKQGGEIITIFCAFYEYMISWPLYIGDPGGYDKHITLLKSMKNARHGNGLLESLKRFTTNGQAFSGTMEEFNDITMNLSKSGVDGVNYINSMVDEAFANMRKPENKEGRKILEYISQRKLVSIDGDILVLNTIISTDILNSLLGGTPGPKNMAELRAIVQELNNQFQGLLKTLLLEEPTADREEKMKALKELTNRYSPNFIVNFNSDDVKNKELLQKLTDIGIRQVVCGYPSYGSLPVEKTESGISLINLAYGDSDPNHDIPDESRSVGYVGKDGKFRFGAKAVKEIHEHPFNKKSTIKLVGWLEDIFSLPDKPQYKLAALIAEDMAKDRDGKERDEAAIEKVVDDIIIYDDLSKIMRYLAQKNTRETKFTPLNTLKLNLKDIKQAYLAADYLLMTKPNLDLEQIYEVLANVDYRSNDFAKQADIYIRGKRRKAIDDRASETSKKSEPDPNTEKLAEKKEKPPEMSSDMKFVQKFLETSLKPSALVSAALANFEKANPGKFKKLRENMENFPEVFDFIFGGQFEGVKFTTSKMQPVKLSENGTAPEMILANLLKYGLDKAKLATKQTELQEFKMAAGGTVTATAVQKYIKDIYSGNLTSFARDIK